MAAVVVGITFADPTNATTYASGAFTPAASDLLVVLGYAAADVVAGTVTNSAGLTFTKVTSGLLTASADTLYVFVADQLAAASSQSCTLNVGPTTATGGIIAVVRISGITRTGLSAIRQTAKQENQAAATPAPAFGVAALTGNPTIAVMANAANPATMTPPASWTERADVGIAAPVRGLEYGSRDSGFTGTTVTWGSASGTAFGAIIVEIDTSAVPATDDVAAYVGGGYYPFAALRRLWQGWKQRDGLLVPPGLWVPA